MAIVPVLGFMPGYGEWLVILVIGLLLFGRRLPEVGRTLGKTAMQLRKGVQDFRSQFESDESVREVRSAVRDFREVADPRALLEDHHGDAGQRATRRPRAEPEEQREARPSDAVERSVREEPC